MVSSGRVGRDGESKSDSGGGFSSSSKECFPSLPGGVGVGGDARGCCGGRAFGESADAKDEGGPRAQKRGTEDSRAERRRSRRVGQSQLVFISGASKRFDVRGVAHWKVLVSASLSS